LIAVHPDPAFSVADTESLPADLQVTIARHLLDGWSPETIVSRLRSMGVPELVARQEIESVEATPALEAGRQVAARRDKLASLLDALGRQFRQAPSAVTVPVEHRPRTDLFFRRYYFENRPVLLKGLMAGWPALTKWSPAYFARRFGGVKIEITDDRDTDARYEDNFFAHRSTVSMREFVERVLHRPGNNSYAVGKNRLLDQPQLNNLLKDFTTPDVLRAAEEGRAPSLWFGPAGTVTPLHHDSSNILFGQVYGRKFVRLIPPFYIERVYNDRACFSAVDLDAVDFESHPDVRDVLVLETTVEPGDFLFIPIGWWHWVRALDVSISLSFQNFAVLGRPVVWRHDSTY
jgi:Cupin-like domain